MNVLLIAGGWSSERKVSLAGAEGIHKTLQGLGHTVSRFDPERSLDGLPEAARGSDFVFIHLHGAPGEDGVIQAMLDQLGLPYQGSGPAASLLALDKAASKAMFRGATLNTAPSVLLCAKPEPGWQPDIPYPLFIKANTGGSSLQMEMVQRPEDLASALERLFSVNVAYLVESAVPTSMELTCGVLGRLDHGREVPQALPPILIRPASGTVFDHHSKYAPGGAEEICPAPISPELTRRIQDMALAAHRILGCSGYSRADFLVPADGEPVLLEVNTLPGMTPTSLFPQEAAAIGLSFADLIARLIELGLAANRRPANSRPD